MNKDVKFKTKPKLIAKALWKRGEESEGRDGAGGGKGRGLDNSGQVYQNEPQVRKESAINRTQHSSRVEGGGGEQA